MGLARLACWARWALQAGPYLVHGAFERIFKAHVQRTGFGD